MFVNPLMLAGLGGAVLPLVLHLLDRARYRQVSWGAMMFLPAADHRQRRAVRFRQFALLALRMTAVGILAVALARPVIGGRQPGGAIRSDGRTATVVLLDCSASMGYATNGRTRFDAAKRAALALLQDLRVGDEAAVFLVGVDDVHGNAAAPAAALTTDVRALADRVADASVTAARCDVAAALNQAVRVFDPPRGESRVAMRKQIVLVTDRQASSWTGVDNDAFAAAFARTGSALVVVPVGGDENDNFAIDAVTLAGGHGSLIRDVPDELSVTVRNFGSVSRAGVPVVVTSAGREHGRQNVSLAAGATTRMSIPVRFSTLGSQVLNVRAATAGNVSGLVADDRLDFAFRVTEPVRVLIVRGEGGSNPRNDRAIDAADVLRAALAPYAAAGEAARPDPAVVEVVNAAAAPWPSVDRRKCDVLILCGIECSEQQLRQVQEFVYDGGGLLILPERGMGIDRVELSPARLRPRAGGGEGAHVESIDDADVSHPALAFSGGPRGSLASLGVVRMFDAEPISDARVLLRAASSGQPLLIEHVLGNGRVMLFNGLIDPNAESSDGLTNPLPRSSLFLPLMQSLTRWLAAGAGHEPRVNLLPGEPIEAVLRDVAPQEGVIVVTPDGTREPIDVSRRPSGAASGWAEARVRFARTRTTGRYELRYDSADDGGPQDTFHYVVRTPPEESDLTPLTSAQWTALEERLRLTRVTPTDLEAGPRGRLAFDPAAAAGSSGATELWASLLASVGAILVLEGWLARRWSTVSA